jgi:glycosyltransferase involved in cell wall biosynthesis
VPHDRSSVVLLGTDLAPPTVTRGNEGYLLSVGTIEPRKNLPTLLEALADIKARRGQVPPLYVAGAPGWGDVGIEAAVARLGLREEVRLLGFVPEARLAELYASALALVYVSLDEGFGFPALEAMACGCPVIAARAGSLPEVVGDAAVLVDPRDVAQIATAIGLLTDPERAQVLRERGRARARALTWRACARGTLDVYRRVGTASPRRGR